MITRPATSYILLLTALIFGSSSCDLINPEEQIPSFLCVDSIAMNVGNLQGTNTHDIVDAWVFDNEQLVGVYELPAVVPILSTGETNIRIRPGVKVNGQAASRSPLSFLEDFSGGVELFEDSVVCVNPTLSYRSNVATPWVEDFEISSQQTLTTTSLSEQTIALVTGSEAIDGKSALLSLNPNQFIFECKSTGEFQLPSAGAEVILEFSYKCNHPFIVSVVSTNPGGSVQTPVFQVNPSEDWNHIYISLTQVASTLFTGLHSPAFGFVRNTGYEDDINVYLDNIRLIHFE